MLPRCRFAMHGVFPRSGPEDDSVATGIQTLVDHKHLPRDWLGHEGVRTPDEINTSLHDHRHLVEHHVSKVEASSSTIWGVFSLAPHSPPAHRHTQIRSGLSSTTQREHTHAHIDDELISLIPCWMKVGIATHRWSSATRVSVARRSSPFHRRFDQRAAGCGREVIARHSTPSFDAARVLKLGQRLSIMAGLLEVPSWTGTRSPTAVIVVVHGSRRPRMRLDFGDMGITLRDQLL